MCWVKLEITRDLKKNNKYRGKWWN
jgi:hypothetical protein